MRLPLYDRSKVYVMALRPTEAVKLHALVAASGRKQLRGYMLREGVTITDLHRELRKIRAKETLKAPDASAFLRRIRVRGATRGGLTYDHHPQRCESARDGAPSISVRVVNGQRRYFEALEPELDDYEAEMFKLDKEFSVA